MPHAASLSSVTPRTEAYPPSSWLTTTRCLLFNIRPLLWALCLFPAADSVPPRLKEADLSSESRLRVSRCPEDTSFLSGTQCLHCHRSDHYVEMYQKPETLLYMGDNRNPEHLKWQLKKETVAPNY